jgi:hypothetical protein
VLQTASIELLYTSEKNGSLVSFFSACCYILLHQGLALLLVLSLALSTTNEYKESFSFGRWLYPGLKWYIRSQTISTFSLRYLVQFKSNLMRVYLCIKRWIRRRPSMKDVTKYLSCLVQIECKILIMLKCILNLVFSIIWDCLRFINDLMFQLNNYSSRHKHYTDY